MDRLGEIQARLNAAPPGPWHRDDVWPDLGMKGRPFAGAGDATNLLGTEGASE